MPGYCILICTKHAAEPYHLPAEDGMTFWRDMMRAGAAIERALTTTKLNFLIAGNALPHTHAHLIPRYHGDSAPGRVLLPPDPTNPATLTPAEHDARAAHIRAALT